MTTNHPPYLKPGSVIGITCPSSHIPMERIAYAVRALENWGFKVKLGKTCGTMHHYFSGTDEERLEDLQAMLDDANVDAILMGRGGYGMTRIIDRLDFTSFCDRPKWICGFSDIVVLLNHVQAKYGIPALHSPMCNAFQPQFIGSAHLQNFFDALTGKPLAYLVPAAPFNRVGNAEGVLTGGNLAILAHLTGSVSEVDTDGKILFIEDVGEYLYNIDRLMLNLKRAGKFDNLKGLIVGGFSDMQDTERPFGQTVEQLIWDKVKEYDYPVCFNFPCGHIDVNYTLTMGMPHTLSVTGEGAILELLR